MITIAELRDRLALATPRIRAGVGQEAARTALDAEARSKRLATERLRVRTGRLRGSIRGTAIEEDGAAFLVRLQAGASPGLPYARIQEEGGVVRAKRRFLAIPTRAAQTRAGVSRYGSPRDVPGLRFVPLRGGSRGMLVRGRGERAEVLFWLVPSVTIRPKRYLADGLDGSTQGLADRLAARVVAALTEGA